MKWTQGYIYTLKESPADAEIASHKLFVRGGFIRKLAPGIFTYGPLLLRSIRKLEAIIREELDQRQCVEVLMPVVQPREVWEETGRWQAWGDDLLKFSDRNEREFCLGPTHEEVITDYVRKDIKSYRDLPKTLYQIQNKVRNEIRPRFGLMRGREFAMKDAYSFDVTEEAAFGSYDRMYEAYVAIFKRLGLNFRVVDADSGNIGGNKSQEFHVLAESGEDHLLVAEDGEFAANVEVCPATRKESEDSKAKEPLPMEEFSTPGLRTIKDLSKSTGVSERELVKTLFYSSSSGEEVRPVAILLCGDDELNPIKLKKVLGLSSEPLMLTDNEVRELTGATPGSCGPVGLQIPIYADHGVMNRVNFIVGANKDDVHIKNVNFERDFQVTQVADLRMAKEGDQNPKGEGVLKSYRGIEVGHIFYLGTKYSQSMGLEYLDDQGKRCPVEMGCYGIGVTRTLQSAVEQSHDKDGIVWPISIAPYQVHICCLDPKDESVAAASEELYDGLIKDGVDVLMDDREERPGVKFKDADLLGMPVRVTIGGRGLKNNELEVVIRKTKEVFKVPVSNVLLKTLEVLRGLKS